MSEVKGISRVNHLGLIPNGLLVETQKTISYRFVVWNRERLIADSDGHHQDPGSWATGIWQTRRLTTESGSLGSGTRSRGHVNAAASPAQPGTSGAAPVALFVLCPEKGHRKIARGFQPLGAECERGPGAGSPWLLTIAPFGARKPRNIKKRQRGFSKNAQRLTPESSLRFGICWAKCYSCHTIYAASNIRCCTTGFGTLVPATTRLHGGWHTMRRPTDRLEASPFLCVDTRRARNRAFPTGDNWTSPRAKTF